MCRHNHHVAVDYFAVGVIAYELMMGRRPYAGKTRKEIKEQMMAKQVTIKKSEIPHGWSCEAADFMTKVFFGFTNLLKVFTKKTSKSPRSKWSCRSKTACLV